jgi:hypothetical protein
MSRTSCGVAAAVFGLLLVCAGLIAAAAAWFWPGRAPLAVPEALRPADREADAVAAHPFWRVKVTRAQLDALVERIRSQQADTVVFVDDTLRVAVETDGRANFQWRALRKAGLRSEREGLGRRQIALDLSKKAARPDRREVLRDLKDALDEEDFHGPR